MLLVIVRSIICTVIRRILNAGRRHPARESARARGDRRSSSDATPYLLKTLRRTERVPLPLSRVE